MSKTAIVQILRFGGVGSVGFIFDGGLLWLLLTIGINPYLARLISFPIAVLITWWLNRIWTFESAARARPFSQLNRYILIQMLGALANYSVYALYLSLTNTSSGHALLGFALGSTLGMVVNFLGMRCLVFKPQTSHHL